MSNQNPLPSSTPNSGSTITTPTTPAATTATPIASAAPATAVVVASSGSNATPVAAVPAAVVRAPIKPLIHPKTITVTFTPNWTQQEIGSPLRPVYVSVVIGPAGTLPEHSQFCFEFLLRCENAPVVDPNATIVPGAVPKSGRALLWYGNKPFPQHAHAVVKSRCRLSSGDELKTVSVALRTHIDEKHPNALVYVKRNEQMLESDDNVGCFKVIHRHRYYLNFTFAPGSTIAQLVGLYAWRPMIYLTTKKVDPKTGRDMVMGSRVFTHFDTNWAQGVEHDPNDSEQKAAVESIAADTKAEELLRSMAREKRIKEIEAILNAAPNPALGAGAAYAYLSGKDRLNDNMQLIERTEALSVVVQPQSHHKPLSSAEFARLRQEHEAGQQKLLAQYQLQYQQHQQALQKYLRDEKERVLRQQPCNTLKELEERFMGKRLPDVIVPDLDISQFVTNIPFQAIIDNFCGPEHEPLSLALSAIDIKARELSLDKTHEACDAANHMLNFLLAVNQLYGWQHVASYIRDPGSYSNQLKTDGTITPGSMDDYQSRGQTLIKRLAHRIDWLLGLQRKANIPFDVEFAIKVIAADRPWLEATNTLMLEAEGKVTEMLVYNQTKYEAFREQQRNNLPVPWPHSPALLTAVQNAGFDLASMMIKRDRSVCKTCGVEASGLLPWRDLWSFHNYKNHKDLSFGAHYRAQTEASRAQAVTDANLRPRGNTALTSPQQERKGDPKPPAASAVSSVSTPAAASSAASVVVVVAQPSEAQASSDGRVDTKSDAERALNLPKQGQIKQTALAKEILLNIAVPTKVVPSKSIVEPSLSTERLSNRPSL